MKVKSIPVGFMDMLLDILELFKMAFTKKGLAIVALCAFVYFLSLYISGSVKTLGLLLSLTGLLAFFILSFFIWFVESDSDD
jgi:hypothetical protein